MLKLRHTALAVLTLTSSVSALAQSAPATSPDSSLGTVLVTGTRARDRTIADSQVPVDVLSRDELLRSAHNNHIGCAGFCF